MSCAVCGGPLPPGSTAQRKTCGERCRKEAQRRRERDAKTPMAGTGENRRALDEELDALEARGLLDKLGAAKVAALRSLADAVDADPRNPQLWREYRAERTALDNLEEHDAFAELMASLRDGADFEATS